jgi:hypothetical protein
MYCMTLKIALYNYTGVTGLSSALSGNKQNGHTYFQISPILLSPNELNSGEIISVSISGLEETDFIYGRRLENILPVRIRKDFQNTLDGDLQPPELSSSDIQMSLMMAQRTRLHYLDYSDILFYIGRISHFWKAFLVHFGIDLCISSVVPHSFTDFLLCCVSTQSRVPFLSQLPGGMSRHAFIYSHLQSECLRNSEYGCNLISDNHAKNDFKSLLAATSDPKNVLIPHAGAKAVRAASAYSRNKRFLLNYIPERFSPLSHLRVLAQQYDEISVDPREKFSKGPIRPRLHVYFMHYQPEASTMPMAKQFACQKYTVSYIRSQLDPEDTLLVKEHPQQFKRTSIAFASEEHLRAFHGFRKPEDYRYIASLNKTYLISRSLSIFDIYHLKPSAWVSYGSIGLQSSLLGLQTNFLDTMNPYKMLESTYAYSEPSCIKDRIEAIYCGLREYLFPISRIDHDTVVSAGICYKNINSITRSHQLNHRRG